MNGFWRNFWRVRSWPKKPIDQKRLSVRMQGSLIRIGIRISGFVINSLMKCLEGWAGAWPKEQSIRFWWRYGSDHNPHPGFLDTEPDRDPGMFFEGFFLYYWDSYRQPGIKRDSPRWRYALYRVLSDILLLLLIPFRHESTRSCPPLALSCPKNAQNFHVVWTLECKLFNRDHGLFSCSFARKAHARACMIMRLSSRRASEIRQPLGEFEKNNIYINK